MKQQQTPPGPYRLCARCGQAHPQGAPFCHRCGQPVGAPPARNERGRAAFSIGVALLLVIAAVGASAPKLPFFGVGGKANPLSALSQGTSVSSPFLGEQGQHQSGELLKATASALGSTLQEIASTPPPVLSRPESTQATLAQTAEQMPADVVAWLQHLERIEGRRMSLASDQIGRAMGLLGVVKDIPTYEEGEEPPTDGRRERVEGDAGSMREEWNALVRDYQSVRPPASCVSLANAYSPALQETAGMILDILDALDRAASDPQAAISTLIGMKGKSESKIGGPSREANRQLGDLCRQFGANPWFEIRADVGGGGLLSRGLSGLPGLDSLGL